MTEQAAPKLDFSKAILLFVMGLAAGMLPVAIGFVDLHEGHAQSAVAAPLLSPKEGELEFEVASVRQNKTNDKALMNVDPTPGDSMVPAGGLYSARNIVLVQYIAFAYRLTNRQLQSVVSQVPWVSEDRFDIEARAEGFKMAAHFKTHDGTVDYSLEWTQVAANAPFGAE